MNKLYRNLSIVVAALMLISIAAIAAPANAATVPEPTPGPIATVEPGTSFVPPLVTVTKDTRVYYAPGDVTSDGSMLYAGQSWYVIGQDTTGQWVLVDVTPELNLWVPRSAFALGNAALPLAD